MSALSDFKALLVARASQVSFDIDQAQYLVAIDNWYPLAEARQALASNSEVTSYSISGRTFTRNSLDVLIQSEQAALQDVLRWLHLSGEGLIDTRWFEGNSVGIYTS